jgi:DNA-binding NtrC family response regulator
VEHLVFIVDDEQSILRLLTHWVKNKWGYKVKTFERAGDMLLALDEENPSLILLDIMLPDINGMEALKTVKQKNEHLPVIMLSAQGNIDVALESLRIGAFDYFTKPIDNERLEKSIQNALNNYELQMRVNHLLSSLQKEYSFENIITADDKMQRVFELVHRVMNNDINVLLQGESGTGKELIAKAIHFNGKRKENPFVVVNCASIPRELLESELFGHEKGAFTGAVGKKIGKFEIANGGTLFLDEIGELEMSLQAKILRVIQEKEFERVGGNEVIKVDVRIISATNRNLYEMVQNKEFREDLYYRLNSFPIHIPPLRERRGDIVLLVDHFIKKFNEKLAMNVTGVTKRAMKYLYDYEWPGNIRELENTIERAMILSDGNKINEETLPDHIKSGKNSAETSAASLFDASAPIIPLEKLKEQAIRHALKVTDGNIQEAAQKLDIGRATLYRLIEKYKIETKKNENSE